jgi:hypothetical protein
MEMDTGKVMVVSDLGGASSGKIPASSLAQAKAPVRHAIFN